jgi:hypothetical protein
MADIFFAISRTISRRYRSASFTFLQSSHRAGRLTDIGFSSSSFILCHRASVVIAFSAFRAYEDMKLLSKNE